MNDLLIKKIKKGRQQVAINIEAKDDPTSLHYSHIQQQSKIIMGRFCKLSIVKIPMAVVHVKNATSRSTLAPHMLCQGKESFSKHHNTI